MEPDKCEGWEWISWEQLQDWTVRQRRGEEGTRRLFPPMISLLEQRPDLDIARAGVKDTSI